MCGGVDCYSSSFVMRSARTMDVWGFDDVSSFVGYFELRYFWVSLQS